MAIFIIIIFDEPADSHVVNFKNYKQLKTKVCFSFVRLGPLFCIILEISGFLYSSTQDKFGFFIKDTKIVHKYVFISVKWEVKCWEGDYVQI